MLWANQSKHEKRPDTKVIFAPRISITVEANSWITLFIYLNSLFIRWPEWKLYYSTIQRPKKHLVILGYCEMNKTISGIIDNHNAYIDLRKQEGRTEKKHRFSHFGKKITIKTNHLNLPPLNLQPVEMKKGLTQRK